MGIEGSAKTSTRKLCLVLGCGDVGFEVASRLKEKGMEVVVVVVVLEAVEEVIICRIPRLYV